MRRWSLLFAGGLLWLFLAAVPALADGGPHVSAVNSGTSTLTADSCAGCHRAHTAQGEFLLAAQSEEALCLSCHGSAGTGATTNVEWGIQYVPTVTGTRPLVPFNISGAAAGVITTSASHGFVVGQSVTVSAGVTGVAAGSYVVATVPADTTFTLVGQTPTGITGTPTVSGADPSQILGALRDGGFLKARIGASNPSRIAYPRGYADSPYNTQYAISERPRVGVGASEDVKSAHIDLTPSAGDGIADTGTVWGKGAAGDLSLGTPLVTLTCVECHNPHGNGNYRILRPVPGIEADPLGAPLPVDVKATYANFSTIVTDGQHGLTVGDEVTLTSVGGLTGTYVVATVTNGFTFKVAASLATIGTVLGVTNTTLTGTVIRPEVPIADVSVDPDGDPSDGIENPTKNYTVIQTKGSQGVDSTYLLYARDVINARTPANGLGVDENQPSVVISGSTTSSTGGYFSTTGAHGLAVGDLVTVTGTAHPGSYTVSSVASAGSVYDRFSVVGTSLTTSSTTGSVVRLGIGGDYSATGGDYFRRLVPWNPALINPSCSNTTFSSNNSAYCGTANDAPNGRPNAITSGPSSLLGQQAFLDQMSTWCSQCHSRYYSASNENIGLHDPISSIADRGIGRTTTTGQIYPVYYENSAGPPAVRTQFGGPSYGDRVTFAGMPAAGLNSGEWYVIETGGTSSTGTWFKVSATMAGDAYTTGFGDSGSAPYTTNLGTFTRVYQSSNSSWGYPREDATYKDQHSTASNRGCTVCHVAHGSNAEMNTANGTSFALNVPYPDGTTTSTSSRLLKVDNRGTCQMCHDPTGTIVEGTLLPNPGGATTVP